MQSLAHPDTTEIRRITSDVTWRMLKTVIVAVAGTKTVPLTDASDIEKKMTADDRTAHDHIVKIIKDATVHTENTVTVIGSGTESMPAPVDRDTIATGNIEAIDLRNVGRPPKSVVSGKPRSAPTSSGSSRRAFSTKSKEQPSVQLLQSS